MIFDGFEEQDFPYMCPNCGHEFDIADSIGVGSYPLCGWRAIMKPQSTMAIGFECPECWTKSCCHASDRTFKLVRKGER
jgi:DNA-directed RNA polymerase subunit RPC12/RpoP